MKRYDFDIHADYSESTNGTWIRYADHCEAMKRIAGDGGQAEPVALTEDQIAVRAGIPFVGLSVKLVKALRRLSFAAQTSGGTAGRDDELMSAIQQAQEALEAAKGKGLEEVAAPSASAQHAEPAVVRKTFVFDGVRNPDFVPLRIEFEPGYPEDVAFGSQRQMDRLKKWLDKFFAMRTAQGASSESAVDSLGQVHHVTPIDLTQPTPSASPAALTGDDHE